MSSKHNFSGKSEHGLNDLIREILEIEYCYIAFQAICIEDHLALDGFHSVFKKRADDKRALVVNVLDYLSQRGGRAVFHPIRPMFPKDARSSIEMLRFSLTIEKQLETSFCTLHSIAESEHDPALEQYLERDLIQGQIELIKETADLITNHERSGVEGLGQFLFDLNLKEQN